MRFYDIERDEIVTLEEVKALYNEFGKDDYETLNDYISACHPRNNGTLVELSDRAEFRLDRKDDDNWFEFVEKSSWLWHTFIFDYSWNEMSFEQAKAECEKEIRSQFGDDTIINWEWYTNELKALENFRHYA